MKYILGIDSGGTKYLVRACTPEGGVVAEYVGPPAPHYRLEREEVIKRVNANMMHAWPNSEVPAKNAFILCAGRQAWIRTGTSRRWMTFTKAFPALCVRYCV